MRRITTFLAVLFVATCVMPLAAKPPKKQETDQALKIMRAIPDTAFMKFTPPNLLEDFTYKKLAKEGWTTKEIFAITDNFVRKNRKEVRGSNGYAMYEKEWRPYWYGLIPNDTIKRFDNEELTVKMQNKINKAFKASADEYVPREFYTPDNRMNGIRNKGMWRHNALLPAAGRIHWIQPHPTDPDKLMVIPDGDGIWRTDNNGKNWIPVTDRIPNRFHRSQARGYCIPVDPDDWNHFFAFMENTDLIYETTDGGNTWTEVPNAKQPTKLGFKRGYAFKDAAGTLKFVGVARNTFTGWDGVLYTSDDKGVTWRIINIPIAQRDLNADGSRRVWLQEFAFDPQDRDIIYITTARGILRSTDGLTFKDGKYNLERMNFKVYNQSKTTLISEGTSFPMPTSDGPVMIEIDPKNPNRMWVGLGQKASSPHKSAFYLSEDKGKTWVTLTNTDTGVGSGQVFGNESPGGWLGGMAINFMDPNFVYGCSMSSAKSSDGGRNFREYAWGYQMKGYHPNGQLYPVSSARHNADNHTMRSTPSGRVFRASDAGILMIDKEINGHEWMNISGDMGQNLFYAARLNEFGDQTIIGNTQDLDAQTYRYGRWGYWRGYEGSTAGINPMSNETYFSGGGGGELEGTSWGNSWIASFSKADVVTSNWYLWRANPIITNGSTSSDLGVVKDIGRSVQPIINNTSQPTMSTRDFALSRDLRVGSSLFVLRGDGNIVRFDNGNSTYTTIKRPAMSGYSPSCIATNPDNVFEIYVGDFQNGILKTMDGGKTWTRISALSGGIPTGVHFNKLYFHEGSGDIYAISNESGVYLLEKGTSEWRVWMKGYNPASFTGAEINYATQEMMIYDYGRGIWIADLENPADRFFKQNFAIKQHSFTNGVRTFGIDTKWDVPLYYNHKWTVNGVERTESPYRYFTANNLKAGDKVQLTLSLREAPDVVTRSAEFVILAETTETLADFKAGNAIYSTGNGRIDLGHLNIFDEDFSVEMWLKPKSTSQAAIIGNRKLDNRDQQGWLLYLHNGLLKFKMTPLAEFPQPSYESKQNYTLDIATNNQIRPNEWTHIALTVEKKGAIRIYVDGELRTTRVRPFRDVGLNSVQPLSFLADGYEYNALDGFADELKIWRKALSLTEIREGMVSKPTHGNADLVYYNDFNAEKTELLKENFTQQGIQSRTRAVVTYPKMTMAVSATHNVYDSISNVEEAVLSGSEQIMLIKSNKSSGVMSANISRFDDVYHASDIRGMTDEHYEFAPNVYLVSIFGNVLSNDSLYLRIPMANTAEFAGEDVYIGSADVSKADWKTLGAPIQVENGNIIIKAKATELNNKLIAFIKVKPAIALKVPAADNEGLLQIYDDVETYSFPFNAELIKSMPAPTAPYALTSSEKIVTVGNLVFENGVGSGLFTVDPKMMGGFNEKTAVSITGEDNRMIPYNLSIQNKIAPKSQGNALRFNGGGAIVGSASDYAALNQSNTISMMGWIRIDNDEFFTSSGVKPMIFFRGGGKTLGMHFDAGELRCHWNEEAWSWGLSTGLKITAADKGKWIHIAMVSTPSSITFYLDGKKFSSNRTMSRTGVLSPLMLAQNYSGDTWFTGAIDQVALWSRSLSEEEVMKYMYNRVLLNDAGLVTYLNMDQTSEFGGLVDLKNNASVSYVGSVATNYPSVFPFMLDTQSGHTGSTLSSTDGLIALKMPVNINGKYYISNINRVPNNYTLSGVVPLYNGHFVVNYMAGQQFKAGDNIEVVCRHSNVTAGQNYTLATRELGRGLAFVKKATVAATADGLVTATLSAADYGAPFEAMWFTEAANLPTVTSAVTGEGGKIILKDDQVGVPVTFTLTSANKGGDIDLVVDKVFASFDNPKINFAEANTVTRTLIIDRSKLNQNDWNNILVGFVGASGENLTVQVGLEPVVELELVNPAENNQLTASSATKALEVKAKLVRGIITEPIKLNIQSDLKYGQSVGSDYLTVTGGEKLANTFTYQPSPYPANAGWNTTANPYLTNFLISKQENIRREGVSSFMYRYHPDSKNFIPYDVRYMDSNLNLKPLEPIIAQVADANAWMAFKGQGRITDYNRRNTEFFALSEEEELSLEIWKDNIMYDRISVRINGFGDEYFVFDQDAPKMMGIMTNSPIIYILGSDNTKYSVKTYLQREREVPLAIKTGMSGDYSFRVSKLFKNSDFKAIFVDGETEKTITQTGEIALANIVGRSTAYEDQYKLKLLMPTSLSSSDESKPHIWAVNDVCHINNLMEATRVEIYNTQGQRIVNTVVYDTEWKTQLNSGVYIVRLINPENRILSGKIIIK